MEDPSVKEDISGQLPKEIFLPNQNGNECEVVSEIIVDIGQADFQYFLKEKDRNHDHDQILYHGCQTIPKREAVAIIGHFELLRTQISNGKVERSNEIRRSNSPI